MISIPWPVLSQTIKLDKKQLLIDITLFQIAPAFAQISGYINAPSKAPQTLALILDNHYIRTLPIQMTDTVDMLLKAS